MSAFTSLAHYYDGINGSAYEPYAEYLIGCFKKADTDIREVLDLGCGTGGIAAVLASRGYDMTALDISPEMLNIARANNEGKNTLLICQDMCDFELYGTVQAIYSSFDCLNYLTRKQDIKKVFSLARNYLETGGVFAFDVNTLYRYEKIYDGRAVVFEPDDDMIVWQSSFDRKTGICDFCIDIFASAEDGSYNRYCEFQKQKYHSEDEILSAASGFTLMEKSGGKGFDGCEPQEKSYYLFKKD